jgi:hypothetical protein
MPDPRERLSDLGKTWDADSARKAISARGEDYKCITHLGKTILLVGDHVSLEGKCRPIELPGAASVNYEQPLDWEKWQPLKSSPQVPDDRRAGNAHIEAVARSLGVDRGIIWAIGEVETGNCGFYADNDSFLPVCRNRITGESGTRRLREIFGEGFFQKALDLCDWGFGRWMVLGLNFSHNTVYISTYDRKSIPCPEQIEIKSGNIVVPEGFKRDNSLGIARRTEIDYHESAYVIRSKTGGDGKVYQQECAYSHVDGKLIKDLNNATPNLYDAFWRFVAHYVDDPGGPVFQRDKIPQRVSLYKFYLDMHTDEWVQLQYFEFVVKGRKNLHEAMKKLSKLIQKRAPQQKIDSAWEEVALLYNGKRYKERGYDKLLKAAYKRSPIKGIP